MKFRVIRLALATLGIKDVKWEDAQHANSDITIKPYGDPVRPGPNETCLMLLEASKCVNSIPMNGDIVYVEDDLRKELETALEEHIDLQAVFLQCSRHISSPHPCVAIEPLDEEAIACLTNKRIHVAPSNVPMRMWHEFSFSKYRRYLLDRQDGVTLLAESLGHTHPTGQLHELIRLFERAFALSAGRICRNELPVFLAQSDLGYTRNEIEHWLDLRDMTSHADRRPTFALQADTRPIVTRAEQAAYDVLFNKDQWRDPSVGRRNVFRPFCGSSDVNGDIFITQGETAKLTMSILDGFNAYPSNLKACITNIPKHWLAVTTAHDASKMLSQPH